ncbi:MAG TPA: aminodeoxychorismate lyase [Gammaproteobacteria bacterium]|nr:aminodeoxychorismate lyase [Gammaproteobacteria bacterium]
MNSLVNGVAADYLAIDDRAIHYGDGLFETILCKDRRLYYWSQHYARLQRSAEKIKLECPDEKVLLDDIARLLGDSGNGEAHAIKIIVTRGSGHPRGYLFDKKITPDHLVFISPIDKNYSSLLSLQLLSGDLFVCEQQASINRNLAGLKHLNRLENVLARNEWRDEAGPDFIEGLMLNADRHVIEGTMSNLFTVKDQQLCTPRLELSGVRGVMRDAVLDIARDNGIDISVRDMRIEEICDMDELFITNSLIGMKKINHITDKKFTENKITDTIFDALLKTKTDHVQTIE